MKRYFDTLVLLAVAGLLASCATTQPAEDTATPSRTQTPEISGPVGKLDEPSRRIGEVNTELRLRVAYLENERARLKEEAARWEAEMAMWEQKGLSSEQRLALALDELKRLRAGWVTQLDNATAGLNAQVVELTAAHRQLEDEKEKLKTAAAQKDIEVANLYVDKRKDKETIDGLRKAADNLKSSIKSRDDRIAVQNFLLKIAAALALYVALHFLSYIPTLRPYLFWLP